MRPILVTVAFLFAGCHTNTRTIGLPSLDVQDASVRMRGYDQVDILFMIDDSVSMQPKQAQLRAGFPGLLARVQQIAGSASYHIGVITSDLGAGPYSQCHPGGDGGMLRTMAGATNVDAACSGITLGGGLSFIDYDPRTGASNVVGGDVTTAFSCLASVGDQGCGFEHQLESTYRALTGANPGFVRDDAMQVVVLLTDEDDCSAPPDSNLFDPGIGGVMAYGPFHSFRCTKQGIVCGGKRLEEKSASYSNCAPMLEADGGKLFDVARYARLFASDRAHGGLKDDPAGVLLVSIAPPATPFATTLTSPCADAQNTITCAVLGHSCVSPSNVNFFGDPAVRIHALMQSTLNGIESSICNSDFGPALDGMASTMAGRMGGGCLPGAVVDPNNPQCTVTVDGVEVGACSKGPSPCWSVVQDATCPGRPTPDATVRQDRLVVQGAPAGSVPTAVCKLYIPTA